jgi:ribosomal protein S30
MHLKIWDSKVGVAYDIVASIPGSWAGHRRNQDRGLNPKRRHNLPPQRHRSLNTAQLYVTESIEKELEVAVGLVAQVCMN